jgi:hypothetical protein
LEPTDEPVYIPIPGDMWIVPAIQTVENSAPCTSEIHANSGTIQLAAYGCEVGYDETLLSLPAEDDVIEGADGFIAAYNAETPGAIIVSGFNATGITPGEDIHMITINWITDDTATGTSVIALTVNDMADKNGVNIGTPNGINGSITIK